LLPLQAIHVPPAAPRAVALQHEVRAKAATLQNPPAQSAIHFEEGEKIDEEALKTLVRGRRTLNKPTAGERSDDETQNRNT